MNVGKGKFKILFIPRKVGHLNSTWIQKYSGHLIDWINRLTLAYTAAIGVVVSVVGRINEVNQHPGPG